MDEPGKTEKAHLWSVSPSQNLATYPCEKVNPLTALLYRLLARLASQGTLVGSVEVCIIRIDQITIGIRLVHVSVRDTRCRSKKRNGTAISLP